MSRTEFEKTDSDDDALPNTRVPIKPVDCQRPESGLKPY